jgi:serine/threonine protein kinase
MTWLSDENVARLRNAADLPEPPNDRYDVIERIASGGMGTVYRVRDLVLDRDVALKVLGSAAPSPAERARMLREARVLARLEHPGIVPVHDAGTLADGRVWYTMRLVRGHRLDEHVRATPDRAGRIRIFERICESVAFAHANGVIHRDLKPSNVMIGAFGEVLVMDWGIAKVRERDGAGPAAAGAPAAAMPAGESGDTRAGSVLGTPGYMAPEQAQGRSDLVDERADIYALGAVLRFLLDDGRPVPRRLSAIVSRAIASDPAQRYARVEALAEDVSRYLSGAQVAAHRESLAERIARVASRHRTAIFLVVAYVVMRLAFLVFARA